MKCCVSRWQQLAREDEVGVLTQLQASQEGGDAAAAADINSQLPATQPSTQASSQHQQQQPQQPGPASQQTTQPLPMSQLPFAGGGGGTGDASPPDDYEPHMTLPDADSPAGGGHSFGRLMPSSEYDPTAAGVWDR